MGKHLPKLETINIEYFLSAMENQNTTLKDGRQIIIRKIQRRDVHGIWENFNEVVEEKIYLPVYTPLINDMDKMYWYDNLTDAENIGVIAEDFNQSFRRRVVAQCTIEDLEWEAASHVGLLGIIVQKGYRNQGLGLQIIEYAKNIARNQNKKKIILSTFVTNQMGLALYKRCGFKEVGRYSKQYKINDEYVDEVLMECWL